MSQMESCNGHYSKLKRSLLFWCYSPWVVGYLSFLFGSEWTLWLVWPVDHGTSDNVPVSGPQAQDQQLLLPLLEWLSLGCSLRGPMVLRPKPQKEATWRYSGRQLTVSVRQPTWTTSPVNPSYDFSLSLPSSCIHMRDLHWEPPTWA